jgi:hypothetical protein
MLDAGARWALCGGAAVYLCCVSVVHGATAQGVVPVIVRTLLTVPQKSSRSAEHLILTVSRVLRVVVYNYEEAFLVGVIGDAW